MPTKTLFRSLDEIIHSLDKKRLADVFRLVSFRPFEKFGPHKHVRIEINFVKKGSCVLHLDNESVYFNENEIMIICSNVNHVFEANATGATLMQLEFLPDIFDHFNSSDDSLGNEPSAVHIFSQSNRLIKIINDIHIVRAVQRILDELHSKQKYHHYLVVMYYAELLILISRHLNETYLPLNTNQKLRQAIVCLQNNFNTDILMEEVASQIGISTRYLRKLFLHCLNISPVEYLNQIRLNKAIELLKNSNLSIKEICYQCGYKSPQYFSRVFKKQTGYSPGKFSMH